MSRRKSGSGLADLVKYGERLEADVGSKMALQHGVDTSAVGYVAGEGNNAVRTGHGMPIAQAQDVTLDFGKGGSRRSIVSMASVRSV